jgi:hypothetical protein
MTAEAWIALAGLVLMFVVAPLAHLAYKFFYRLNKRVDVVHSNHLPHIELYLRLICDKLGIIYTDPEKE